MHTKQFQINQLRMKNMQKVIESLMVIVLSIVVTAVLPSILVQFLLTSASNPFEQPAILQYIPVASFAVAIGYLALVMIGNWSREKTIAKLESEMLESDCGCGGACGNDCCGGSDLPPVTEAELEELEGIVEQALNKSGASKKSSVSSKKRVMAKKAGRKTSTKK
ncbi:MAG: hypothetical protein WAU07_05625 [Microgenomates group bacterium]